MGKPNTIKIDEVEYVRADSIPDALPVDGCPFIPGRSYFIRTVTYHLTGRVRQVVGGFLLLSDAAWIADSGRFANAIKSGTLSEVEPVGEWIVSLSAITDAGEWLHPLPTAQK